jgi:chromosome segregation ATPase
MIDFRSPSPLLAHLDAQLTTLRAELSTLYRTQAAAQNKQLSLSDALRDRDEEVRGLREEVRILRDAKDLAARREKEWEEKWKMRTRDMEVGQSPNAYS